VAADIELFLGVNAVLYETFSRCQKVWNFKTKHQQYIQQRM